MSPGGITHAAQQPVPASSLTRDAVAAHRGGDGGRRAVAAGARQIPRASGHRQSGPVGSQPAGQRSRSSTTSPERSRSSTPVCNRRCSRSTRRQRWALRTASPRIAALRLRDDLAVTLIPSTPSLEMGTTALIVARDAASGLAVVRVPTPLPAPPPVPWTPRQPQQSRYLGCQRPRHQRGCRCARYLPARSIRSTVRCGRNRCGPCRGAPISSAGSFLFTSTAELAGLVIAHRGGLRSCRAGPFWRKRSVCWPRRRAPRGPSASRCRI